MRVLFTAVPQAGHVYPVLPLAAALAAQGDDVLVAGAPGATGRATAAGLPVAAVGAEFGAWWQELAARTRGAPGDGLPPHRVLRYFVPRLFAEIGADATVDDLLELGRQWRPDLVVGDPYAFAAPLVARLLDVPYAQHTIGPAVELATLELAGDAVSPLWRAYGLEPPEYGGVFAGTTVNICPAALEPAPAPPGADVLDLRPAQPVGDPGPAPAWLGRLSDRPTVYATLGTFSNTDLAVFRAILEGLAAEPLAVVVTVGADQGPAALGPLPANAHVERYIAQDLLLPHCAAVISHAGSGTMLGALGYGLPQLAIPQGADNFVNADRLVAARAARQLRPGEVTADAVRSGVHEVLNDPSYRDGARRVAAQIAAMPAPAEVAGVLRQRYGRH